MGESSFTMGGDEGGAYVPLQPRISSRMRHGRMTELMVQIDAEICDVDDEEITDVDNDALHSEENPRPSVWGAGPAATAGRSDGKRGLMPGGLAGGVSLGGNPALKSGPKDHAYDIVDGEAKARVYDTPELRAAFLHYCNSSIHVTEMHRVHSGPFMAAQQLVQLCRDYHLLEPEGKPRA
ncbi:uncharacterized protein HaLaN_02535, partial [Haematococcus lacustris]